MADDDDNDKTLVKWRGKTDTRLALLEKSDQDHAEKLDALFDRTTEIKNTVSAVQTAVTRIDERESTRTRTLTVVLSSGIALATLVISAVVAFSGGADG